jgi:hypothetical protein
MVDHGTGLMEQYGVHENKWLTGSATGRIAADLLWAGYAFDFVSDAQLMRLKVDGKTFIASGGGRYRAIVVPATRRMSVETLEQLRDLAKRTGRVIIESLPQDVPGYSQLEARRTKFRELATARALTLAVTGYDILPALTKLGVRQEQTPQAGLVHIRRARADGHDYFFANLTGKAFDGWLQLGVSAESAIILDPLTGQAGTAAVKRGAEDRLQVYLQLESGQSMLVSTSRTKSKRPAQSWRYTKPSGEGIALQGDWSLEFIRGGPVLPGPGRKRARASWTTHDDPQAKTDAGTPR